VTADLMDPTATINVDITNMFSVPDRSFDPDFLGRLEAGGFDVRIYWPSEIVGFRRPAIRYSS
jgi:hypothetical protein